VQFREFVVVLFLIVLITTFSLSAENFDTITNARNILTNVSIVAVVGAGETLVVLTRRVDISVGSIVGLSGYACAYIISHDHGVPLIVAVLAAMGVGLGIGIINGILVAVCGIPAIIATLAMLGIGRGLDTVITGGQGIQTFQLPTRFVTFTSQNLIGVPFLGWIAIAVVVLSALGLRFSRSGRDLYAIGSNPVAARTIGIPVGRRVFSAMALSGMLAGLGGFIYVAQYDSVDATAGLGFEFTVITAVVVGGVKFMGGSGSTVAAALGALLVVIVQDGFILLKVSEFWTLFLDGSAIVVAVTFDAVVTKKLQDSLIRARRRGGPFEIAPVGSGTGAALYGEPSLEDNSAAR
jgi:rhamnose transport system permease protein